jgi:hypothetical protein
LTSFPRSIPLAAPGAAYPRLSFFDFFEGFYGAAKVIDSLYVSEPPAAQIISSVLEWKNTPTTTGLIIRATETASMLSFTERLQILFLLAFASHDFKLKFSCLVSELEDTTEIARWLENFILAVESKLELGLAEMSCFDEEEQKNMIEAYSRKVKNIDIEIVEIPEDLVSRFSNHRTNIITDVHSTVKPDVFALPASKSGMARSEWGTEIEDDDFWN